jgi:hypothetical protein
MTSAIAVENTGPVLRNETIKRSSQFRPVTHCLGCRREFGLEVPTSEEFRAYFGPWIIKRVSEDPDSWEHAYCAGCVWREADEHCQKCDRRFEPSETVFRNRGRNYCEACAPKEYPVFYGKTKPCEGCGRPVRNRWRKAEVERCEALPRRTFCSRVCVMRSQVQDRKDQRAARPPMACIVCGDPVLRNRRDAKTCSSACRQRHYRERAKFALTQHLDRKRAKA